ncbi:MAG: hypothetical protein ACPG31_00170 [Planctomycetota bacterium]
MMRTLTNSSIRFLGSGPGLAIILVIALAWVVVHLSGLKSESGRLQEEVAGKQETFTRNIAFANGSANHKFAKSELAKWQDLAEHEASRISALSIVAQSAEATIVSLRSRESEVLKEQGLARLSHEIETVGQQHQIAAFLDGIYSMEGMASIESMVLTAEDEDDPETLVAFLTVTWHAPHETEEDPS